MKSKHTLIPLSSRELRKAGIPVSVNTLRDWRKKGKYPQLFVKIGRRVYLVLEKWDQLISEQIRKQIH